MIVLSVSPGVDAVCYTRAAGSLALLQQGLGPTSAWVMHAESTGKCARFLVLAEEPHRVIALHDPDGNRLVMGVQ
ncbi:hypothetical protein CCR82_06505 [Halochromatium salexigens]|uniref:Uncharacterized protein n=1 Tax=Halochromatium salexigens TaxID=49447 RepID=A0AAJ0UEW4_HALSE|nr:hypothetical protein [Halochromatium salexigens]